MLALGPSWASWCTWSPKGERRCVCKESRYKVFRFLHCKGASPPVRLEGGGSHLADCSVPPLCLLRALMPGLTITGRQPLAPAGPWSRSSVGFQSLPAQIWADAQPRAVSWLPRPHVFQWEHAVSCALGQRRLHGCQGGRRWERSPGVWEAKVRRADQAQSPATSQRTWPTAA